MELSLQTFTNTFVTIQFITFMGPTWMRYFITFGCFINHLQPHKKHAMRVDIHILEVIPILQLSIYCQIYLVYLCVCIHAYMYLVGLTFAINSQQTCVHINSFQVSCSCLKQSQEEFKPCYRWIQETNTLPILDKEEILTNEVIV